MRSLADRVWFKKSQHKFIGRIEFCKEVMCLDSNKIAISQELSICDQIKEDILHDIFGELPAHCAALVRQLSEASKTFAAIEDAQLRQQLAKVAELAQAVCDEVGWPHPATSELKEMQRWQELNNVD